ncbi:hypothetical protein EYF80_028060 [Liparis tanakae]|uniref:Uncharacterized protein n=1 Tax=Liparis tanakae TaxID=230148 RepID=A0A4Z2H6Y9_9TELE|nr:hypothetical protein EYF80_028060 [Liparis tanakae]
MLVCRCSGSEISRNPLAHLGAASRTDVPVVPFRALYKCTVRHDGTTSNDWSGCLGSLEYADK